MLSSAGAKNLQFLPRITTKVVKIHASSTEQAQGRKRKYLHSFTWQISTDVIYLNAYT